MGRRTSIAGLSGSALAMVLLGAWAGIVVFVGPVFGYSVDGSGSWHWSVAHGWLHFGPGALAVVAGLVALGSLPRAIAGHRNRGAGVAGVMVIVSGAWLVVGPTAWPTMVSGAHVWLPASALRNLADQIGANLGPGVLLIAVGALSLGLTGHRRADQVVLRAPDERAPLAA